MKEMNLMNYREFDFICKHCGWQGKGSELSLGEFSEIHCIQDFDCPSCYEHIGYAQAPLIEDIKREERLKYLRENPPPPRVFTKYPRKLKKKMKK